MITFWEELSENDKTGISNLIDTRDCSSDENCRLNINSTCQRCEQEPVRKACICLNSRHVLTQPPLFKSPLCFRSFLSPRVTETSTDHTTYPTSLLTCRRYTWTCVLRTPFDHRPCPHVFSVRVFRLYGNIGVD
jgi:hypothetical protein